MLFNTLEFGIFFFIIFILYWFVTNKSLRIQNVLLLLASYYFYACWDWRFLFLLAFSTFVGYYGGIKIHEAKSTSGRKLWLAISVIVSVGLLAYFKYANFFIESFADLLRFIGLQPHINTLRIILPVGISFYTFHNLSYIIDIYYKKIKPTYNAVDYGVFVSFFPLLVAGPIERATHLLPQIEKKRSFDYSSAVSGLRQILWGLFKKIVIADNCAELADNIFANYDGYSGSTLVVGIIMFSIQIYGDFSGYSDIALGTARLLGFNLLKNFNFPYFSRDIAEFWRRWHISLSTWFRDYLYIPLGGSRGGTGMRIRNTFIIFIVSGFWHGANWTFIMWGFLNALFMMPSMIMKTNRKNLDIVAKGKMLPSLPEAFQLIVTFALTTFAWIFFRSDTISDAFSYIGGIFSKSLFTMPENYSALIFLFVAFMMLVEWFGRTGNFALEKIGSAFKNKPLRWTFYIILIIMIVLYSGKQQQFIYFEF